MTESEFIDRMIGVPWVNRGDTFDAVDCYGLIKLWRSEVVGRPLAEVNGYKRGDDFEGLWRKYIDQHWREVNNYKRGAMVTFYDYADTPVHIGLCIGQSMVLHARGDDARGGKVEIHSIYTLQRLYKRVTYHEAV